MARPARPELREALLEAARAEFAAHGLERARVEDVARRAGISKGAFYLHFETKEAAFDEIVQRFTGAIEDQARRREEAEARFQRDHAGKPAAELHRLQLAFDCEMDADLLETLWRNRQVSAVIDGAGGGRYRAIVAEFRRRMHAFVAGRMRYKQAVGWIRRDLAPEVLADLLVGAYEAFARRMAELPEKPDLAAWLRSLGTTLYEGVLERPDAAPADPAAPRAVRAGRRPRRARA